MRIKTLLIANRGEIARRIARTARRLGIRPVTIHSEADAEAAHLREIGQSVHVGGWPAAESYLKIGAIIDAARRVGADAVHPGYGFLAENAEFAGAVEAEGMVFVGPTAETLACFGDKAAAKRAAIAAGVPVIPGDETALSDPAAIAARVRKMGLPALLKAAGGGGGRGQRLVTDEATLEADIAAALREARSSFGSEALLIERFLPAARHVEVQIIGDRCGRVLHLFERDCTLQRRHQKVIEEAPAPNLRASLREAMLADAVRLGESLDYRSLGTVEFLVAGEDYFFLEVNPRIQVEHPVTEAITGLDLVELQLRIAEGAGLGLDQDDIHTHGHAIEARLYAEDPAQNFAPSTGRITALSLPGGAIRIDSGVEEGDEVSPFYDPMIAKLISRGPDRETALARLALALRHTGVAGVTTNREFLLRLVEHPDFAAMAVHTRWIDARIGELIAPPRPERLDLWRAVAAVLFVMTGRREGDPSPVHNRETFTGWRLGLGGDPLDAGQRVALSFGAEAEEELRVGPIGRGGSFTVYDAEDRALQLATVEVAPGRWRITHEGKALMIDAETRRDLIVLDTPDGRLQFRAAPPLAHASEAGAGEREVVAPLTGAIVAVKVMESQQVTEGDVIAIMESMKLEISIRAGCAGTVRSVAVSPGQMVDRGAVIAEIDPDQGDRDE